MSSGCACVWHDRVLCPVCLLVSSECAQYMSCLYVCFWAWALPRSLHPQSSFPRCPTFPANLLLTSAPNLSQRSLLGGWRWVGVGGEGRGALWQLHRRCSLKQNAEGHREKSHFPIITLSSYIPWHTSLLPCMRCSKLKSWLLGRWEMIEPQTVGFTTKVHRVKNGT